MKRLIKSLTLSIAALFALSGSALATPSEGWRVNISSPANTTSKSFKVQYTTLSIGAEDNITVELFENDESKGTQTTVKPYGDSGSFDLTVPSTGTYQYSIKATNSGDPTVKTTSAVEVVVSDEPQPTTNTVNTGSTESNTTGDTVSSNSGLASTSGEAGDGNQSDEGQVGDEPATTGAQEDEEVLGEQTAADENKGTNPALALAILAAIIGVGFGAYRYWQMRRDR